MPIRGIDSAIPSDVLPSDIQAKVIEGQQQTAEKLADTDGEAAARRAAERKVAEKLSAIKQSVVNRETYQKATRLDQQMQQVLGGAHGPDAQQALLGFNNNQQLQAKLTETQKNMFREAMAQNPPRATEAGKALGRLTQQPGFQKAITSSPQMGTLQGAILQNARGNEKPASDMLASRFMQSPKSDAATKNQFMRFGFEQAGKGNLDAVKKAGDMLGTLSGNGMPRGAQKAAMAMVRRNPLDTAAMSNVDKFALNADVRAMPSFARGKAAELLCKANGQSEVQEGFSQLAANPKFKALAAENKGRTFATLGTGRASEFRQLTDKALTALQSGDFPKRSGQVSRFLGKMSAQIQKGGAANVDTGAAVRDAKKSPLPAPPVWKPVAGLGEDEAREARAHNRAQILSFFNQMTRLYDQTEKRLNTIKARQANNTAYIEDVNALTNLRPPPSIDISALSPDEQAVYLDRQASVLKRHEQVKKQFSTMQRLLKGKRMPAFKRRELADAQRVQGKQERYFKPGLAKPLATSVAPKGASARPVSSGLPVNPQQASRGQRSASSAVVTPGAVQNAIAKLGAGPLTPDKVAHVASSIAQQVAAEVMQRVTAQLLGETPAVGMADPNIANIPEAELALIKKSERSPAPRLDKWGVPRATDRDLSGPVSPVKPKGAEMSELATPKYTGKTIVKDPTSLGELDEFWSTNWRALSKPQQAVLKNLGWTQQMWDTKDTAAAKWPAAMATHYAGLNLTQQAAVAALTKNDPEKWNRWVAQYQRVAEGKMGGNV